MNIILPVGISFYTFQTLSYVIDAYKRKLEPTRDFISFSAFVSFFPQLVAGPIERATRLLPQFYTHRSFDYPKAVDGLRQILWGLFKKIVIADTCAEYADLIFNGSENYSGSTLVIGALFFTCQIYCDFSGYSDIAIGTARLFGFDLMRNFNFPYFSRDVAEFWSRWHISLSTWFRDYVYIPLGGSRAGIRKTIINILIVFIVSGLWHGANWTFVAWGALNALYVLPLVVIKARHSNLNIVAHGKYLPSLKELWQVTLTFSLTVFAWIFFRAENISHAASYISGMFEGLLHKAGYVETINLLYYEIGFVLPVMIVVFFIIEWLGRNEQYATAALGIRWKRPLRYAFYYAIVISIIWFGGKEQQFIYFQF